MSRTEAGPEAELLDQLRCLGARASILAWRAGHYPYSRSISLSVCWSSRNSTAVPCSSRTVPPRRPCLLSERCRPTSRLTSSGNYRPPTTSRRDLRPAGGVWQGVNARTGTVASAIWVNRPGWQQAIVFIEIDGESLGVQRHAE
jgi:hypothetical protein